jgi:hypothetical protein
MTQTITTGRPMLPIPALTLRFLCPEVEIMCKDVQHSSYNLPLEAIDISAAIRVTGEITTFLRLKWQ